MSPAASPSHVDVAIVGAGFGGLGMAIELKRAGHDDFVVLERAADVGGTWFANTYPGCQCDIPSNLYSFSFAPNPEWTHGYPLQPQIHDYLRDCARRFGVLPHTRFRCELQGAAWDESERRWQLETAQGPLAARVLIAATGLLSDPVVPRFPGLERFEGAAFHSARWDHSHDLTGERVALLGTGASAIQIGPRIEPLVSRLHVFQRTPPWILPHPDHPIGGLLQRLYRTLPAAQRLARGAVYGLHETLVPGMTRDRQLLALQRATSKALLRIQVRDRKLRRRLTPGYEWGCKRVLLSNEWYPMFSKPGVELVTEPITEVRERSVVTADGRERELDAIVFATGFRPSDPPIAHHLRGAAGATLAETWDGSPRAYLSTTVAGFPNLFLLYGPNSNLGHNSIVYMLESQYRYVVDALETMRRDELAAVQVRREVQDAWNDELQRRLATTVWNSGGCASWYLDRHGRNSIMWPGFTFEFRHRTRTFDLASYHAEPVGAAAGEGLAVV